MEKKKIGIDIDDVVVECARHFLEIYEKEHGRKISYEDMTSYYCPKHLELSNKQIRKLFDIFENSCFLHNPKVIKGAKRNLNLLARNYQIIFITSRGSHIKDQTLTLLKKCFPDINFGVYHSSDMWGGKSKTKVDICKELGIYYMLEDSLNTARKCASNGIKCLLFNRPWNQGDVEHKNIIRVNNWEEVNQILN